MRPIFLIAAAAVLSAPAHAEPVQDVAISSTTAVMDCLKQDMVTGNMSTANGTMWRLGQGQVVTAFHVWNIGRCGGDHQDFHPVFTDYDMDIAILATQYPNENALKIDCSPMVKGDTFSAYGYTRATGLLKVSVTYTGRKLTSKDTPRWPGGAIMKGANRSVIFEHGTSGGPVINDRTGLVQGIIVGHDESGPLVTTGESYVRVLADTPLCGKTTDQLLTENGVHVLTIKAKK